jgi:hypothetical protein
MGKEWDPVECGKCGWEGGRECENLGRLLDWNGLFKDGRYGSLRGKEGERGGTVVVSRR